MGSQEEYRFMNTNSKVWQGSFEVPSWVERVISGVPEGTRHSTAVRLVGRWYGKGLHQSEVFILLVRWNEMNRPPLSGEEIISISDSTKKWERPQKLSYLIDEEARAIIEEVKKDSGR